MKTALITGASRGLGKALACEFSDNGYGLILNNRNGISVLPDHRTVNGDIAKETTRYKLVLAAKEVDLDILINNVGVYHNGSFVDMENDRIQRMLKVNLIAPMLLTKMILSIFQKKKSGLIININSHAGRHGVDGESVYCASKHGLSGFSNSLKYEINKYGIKILDVYLGAMKTDMTKLRSDWDNLISPKDAAKAIFNASENYETMNIAEINLSRRNY